jgi:hypothetical protein
MGGMGRDFDGSYAEYVLAPKESFSPCRLNLIGRFLVHFPKWFKLLTGIFIKVSKSKRDRPF